MRVDVSDREGGLEAPCLDEVAPRIEHLVVTLGGDARQRPTERAPLVKELKHGLDAPHRVLVGSRARAVVLAEVHDPLDEEVEVDVEDALHAY